jgi:multiple sugar transport system substrate-binding protein
VDNCEVMVEVFDIISQEYEACVIYGKKSPEDAVREAAQAVDVLLGN